jgi:hypothetical protein
MGAKGMPMRLAVVLLLGLLMAQPVGLLLALPVLAQSFN